MDIKGKIKNALRSTAIIFKEEKKIPISWFFLKLVDIHIHMI